MLSFQYQAIRLAGEKRLWYYLFIVDRDLKPNLKSTIQPAAVEISSV